VVDTGDFLPEVAAGEFAEHAAAVMANVTSNAASPTADGALLVVDCCTVTILLLRATMPQVVRSTHHPNGRARPHRLRPNRETRVDPHCCGGPHGVSSTTGASATPQPGCRSRSRRSQW
jgi:hypothetical protein